jgi:hypothetical protein
LPIATAHWKGIDAKGNGNFRAARKRKRQQFGKCEGRKSHREARPEDPAVNSRRRCCPTKKEILDNNHHKERIIHAKEWKTRLAKLLKKAA